MNREEIMQKVNDIFRDVFDDDELVVVDSTCADDIEDWDSLEQINIIMAMQTEFNIKFDLEEASGLANVGEMVDLIIAKLS